MTTKKKLLEKISELEHKQELMERKIEFLVNKDDGRAVLSTELCVDLWQSVVRVYYLYCGEPKCTEIMAFPKDAKIVYEDKNSIVVCLTSGTGGKTYKLINKLTGITVIAPAGFSFEKEEKEGDDKT